MLLKGSLILILVISGCCKAQQIESHLADSLSDTTLIQEDNRSSSTKEKSTVANSDNYSSKFLYKDSASNVNQVLFVEWRSKDTIKFRLVSDNDLCKYEQTGIAVNKYPDMDPEIDTDKEGLSFPTNEYQVVDGGQLFSIRIDIIERAKATIKYIYDDPRDECDPESDAIMNIAKNAEDTSR